MCQEIYTFIYSMKCSLSVYYILGTEKAKDISMQLPSSEKSVEDKERGCSCALSCHSFWSFEPREMQSLNNKLGPSQGEVHGNKEGKD